MNAGFWLVALERYQRIYQQKEKCPPSLIHMPDLPDDNFLDDSFVLVPLGKTHVAALVPLDGVNGLDTIAHGAGRVELVNAVALQAVPKRRHFSFLRYL